VTWNSQLAYPGWGIERKSERATSALGFRPLIGRRDASSRSPGIIVIGNPNLQLDENKSPVLALQDSSPAHPREMIRLPASTIGAV
jgi:hypothetical protein